MTTTITPPDLMARLRDGTRAAHDDTEAIPFSAAIVDRTLPRPIFIAHLRAMQCVHEALEQALRTCDEPAVRAVWTEQLAKMPLLSRDLEALGRPALSGETRAAVQSLVSDIEQTAAEAPVALLGFLYVLEGSTLGATILRQHLSAMYALDEHSGLAYYWPYGRDVMANWKRFKASMNAAPIAAHQHESIIDAAQRAFGGIGAILRTFTAELDRESTAPGGTGS